MVIDAFTFWKELDLLEIRFNILDPYVDKFILVESHQTFSGNPKPLYYEENKERFAKWNDKIVHIVVPNIETQNLFERHYLCYEAIENKIKEIAKPEDIAFCSDLDEIWNPKAIELVDDDIHSLGMLNYSYWLDYLSNEDWVGSLMSKVKNIEFGYNKTYRTVKPNLIPFMGWHFSNQGGVDMIISKLQDYDHANDVLPLKQFEGYGVKARMENGYDFLGREYNYQGVPFAFQQTEEGLPQYLIENKEKWKHLFKS